MCVGGTLCECLCLSSPGPVGLAKPLLFSAPPFLHPPNSGRGGWGVPNGRADAGLPGSLSLPWGPRGDRVEEHGFPITQTSSQEGGVRKWPLPWVQSAGLLPGGHAPSTLVPRGPGPCGCWHPQQGTFNLSCRVMSKKEYKFGARQTWVQILILLLLGCVALDQSLLPAAAIK